MIPEKKVEIEQWLITKSRRGEGTEYVTQSEVELGLPGRFQLDLYLDTRNNAPEHPSHVFVEPMVELRNHLAHRHYAGWGAVVELMDIRRRLSLSSSC